MSTQGVPATGCLPRGVSARGCVCQKGVYMCLSRSVSQESVRLGASAQGLCIPACTGLGYTHPTMDRMTDAFENITLPQLCLG